MSRIHFQFFILIILLIFLLSYCIFVSFWFLSSTTDSLDCNLRCYGMAVWVFVWIVLVKCGDIRYLYVYSSIITPLWTLSKNSFSAVIILNHVKTRQVPLVCGLCFLSLSLKNWKNREMSASSLSQSKINSSYTHRHYTIIVKICENKKDNNGIFENWDSTVPPSSPPHIVCVCAMVFG